MALANINYRRTSPSKIYLTNDYSDSYGAGGSRGLGMSFTGNFIQYTVSNGGAGSYFAQKPYLLPSGSPANYTGDGASYFSTTAISGDGRIIAGQRAGASPKIYIYNTSDLSLIRILDLNALGISQTTTYNMCFNFDGTKIAFTTPSTVIISVTTGLILRTIAGTVSVLSMCCDYNMDFVAIFTYANPGTLKIFNVNTGTETASFPTAYSFTASNTKTCSMSADARIVCYGAAGVKKITNLVTSTTVSTNDYGFEGSIWVTPDGSRVFIVDITNNRIVMVYPTDPTTVVCAYPNPTSYNYERRTLISGNYDGSSLVVSNPLSSTQKSIYFY